MSSKSSKQMNKLMALVMVLIVLLIMLSVLLVLKKRGETRSYDGYSSVEIEKSSIEESERDQQIEETNANQEAGEDEKAELEQPESASVEEPITICFTGDVLFDYEMPAHYDENGVLGIVSPDMLEVLSGADITMVNEEFPFGVGGERQEKKYTYKCDPKYVTAMQELGVDVVSLANNHALDFGRDVLSQTFVTLDNAGIKYAGAGETLDRARELQLVEAGGKTVGFLAASRVIPYTSWNITDGQPGMLCTYDPSLLVAAIEDARDKCDFLVVYVHWGVERVEYPEEYERIMAKQYIQAGADAVIGSHPHVLQGIEFIDGKPVFYSLGNFIFVQTIDKTMAVNVDLDNDGNAVWSIVPAQASGGLTYVLEGDAAQNVINYVESISFGVDIDENGVITPIQ